MALTSQQLAAYIGRLTTADSPPALRALAHDIRASDAADEAAVLLRIIARKLSDPPPPGLEVPELLTEP